jgi:aerobic carbon-monoxide dehydrogenase small subunit
MWINFTLNGAPHERDVHPGATLLEMLREDLRVTSVKEGCGKGECGACTVLLDGQPVDSCLILAAQVDGADLTTVEGLARGGQLHAVQRALLDEGGVQCGFCTPGLAVAAARLVDEAARHGAVPTRAEILESIEGNLCRCTGYRKVIAAIEKAAAQAVGAAKSGGA